MHWTTFKVSTRKVILSVAALCLAVIGLFGGAQLSTTDASTSGAETSVGIPAATFPGTNLGAIPDGLAGTPPQFGTARVINFAVSGVAGPISNIDINYALTHTYVGDIEAVLAAPGGTPSMHIASRVGVTAAGSFGDSSNYGGMYTFDDSAAGLNIWSVATDAGCGTDCIVAAGTYRTIQPGQIGQTNPAPVTSLQTTFGGLNDGQINGTWTLTFRDAASADTGSVTAANLIIDGGTGPAPDAPVDFNGDGRSDYVVVRNVGGGPTGQVRWYYNLSSGGATVAKDWGLGADFFLAEDFDNDNIDDISVWRPGPATVAAFYILNSATNTARIEAFGQTGDDPTVVDDYNGDGSADLAVYRGAAAAGQQSVWYYRTAPGGALTYTPWGVSGDLPAPGDYDGDGKADFVVQRDNGGGQAIFWRLFSNGAIDNVFFGLSSDVVVPGDYDDDGKTDVAVFRPVGGSMVWYYEPSSVAGVSFVQNTFGNSATDYAVQADYDGDGRTEIAVWRDGVFWIYNLQSGAISTYNLGTAGDYPVANFIVH